MQKGRILKTSKSRCVVTWFENGITHAKIKFSQIYCDIGSQNNCRFVIFEIDADEKAWYKKKKFFAI
ncbi:hypothetical protein BpHYR1_039184 [Brachionus plicatilis]|uniref:Uncharacterized protein n=1 Tax=Brachionus plicatilis TaxID=10195 RepID=A0A3M7P9V8_BRAPC|nr:hypothetical protein BpHYR1_039184 [Brachionus plicatilis]